MRPTLAHPYMPTCPPSLVDYSGSGHCRKESRSVIFRLAKSSDFGHALFFQDNDYVFIHAFYWLIIKTIYINKKSKRDWATDPAHPFKPFLKILIAVECD